jgi:hypothetical protein
MNIMNNIIKFALLAMGLIATLGIAASDCIHVFTLDKNQEPIEGARVYLEAAANFAGETDANGYLLVPLGENESYIKDHSVFNDDVWNITTDWKNKIGYAMVTVPAGTCQNVTINMTY